jgi:hypothetical protein
MPLLNCDHSEEQQKSIRGTQIPQTETPDAILQKKRRMSSISGGNLTCRTTHIWLIKHTVCERSQNTSPF